MNTEVTQRPVVHKVRIEGDDVYVNGERVAYLSGTRSEVWLNAENASRSFMARFKYMKPRTKAKRFIKAVLSRVTVQEYLDLLATARSPRDVAESIGADY